jgi:hypothetical protein
VNKLLDICGDPDRPEVEEVRAQARMQAREEIGEYCDLAQAGASASLLLNELDMRARLDDMIDKCLKRLLFVRGVKSVGRAGPAAAPRLAHVPAREVPLQAGEAEQIPSPAGA